MSDSRRCKSCGKNKKLTDFYMNQGYLRRTCKKCLIRKNTSYAKSKGYSSSSYDNEKMKLYMRAYRAQNKEKIISYRKTFQLKHPNYHTEYYRKHRDDGYIKTPTTQCNGRKNVTRVQTGESFAIQPNDPLDNTFHQWGL